MKIGWAEQRRVSSWVDSVRLALFLLVIQPIIVKAPLLFGILKADPRLKLSGLAGSKYTGLPGATTIDPNVAYTSHALGTYAAKAMFNGGSLWWNPYEGVGTPLAAEMQSAAFFPPTWLMILPNGQLLEHLLFQIIAGLATFLFVRRLGANVLASWFAATLFSFNGTFAWLANAVINPICLLPVVMLGVELVRSRVSRDRTIGCCCISLGIAGSLYAGFPETAYLNGLMIAGWTLVRAVDDRHDWRSVRDFLLRAGVSALSGCLLAAPLLLPFVDYLSIANLGLHGAGGITGFIRPVYVAMFFVPYLSGAITHNHADFWGGTGGYIGVIPMVLAIAGVMGRPYRALRMYLFAWVLIGASVTYGIEPFNGLIRWFPGVSSVAIYRYITPSLLFSLAVLAGLFVSDFSAKNDLLNHLRSSTMIVGASLSILVIVAIAAGVRPETRIELLPIVAQLMLVGLFLIAVFSGRWSMRSRATMITLAGVLEAIALFMTPMASYPVKRPLYLDEIAFLKGNLGLQRFVSAGPISKTGSVAANYGSYFEIAQVNWNDLPIPQSLVSYVRRNIDRDADAIVFRVTPEKFLQGIAGYAAMGVKYVTVPKDIHLPGLRQVYAGEIMRVYAVPGTKPYFGAPGCDVTATGRMTVVTRCLHPSQLQRLELFMDGWKARVNGHPTSVERTGQIFQAVNVPAGTSTTEFTFTPPSVMLGYVLALIGGLLLVGGLAMPMRARRPESPGDRAMAA